MEIKIVAQDLKNELRSTSIDVSGHPLVREIDALCLQALPSMALPSLRTWWWYTEDSQWTKPYRNRADQGGLR
jgi:hypothetical protein